MLDGIGPLLTGASDKRPTVGDNWPEHPGLSIAELEAAAPECICWHIGAAPGHVAIDIDGPDAAAFCQSHGCDPYTADTWRIIRTSNAERLKLVFTVMPEQKAALVEGAKTVKINGQELAVFAKHGTQIVVLGNHYTKESGYTENDDQYAWAGRAPADAQPVPPEWFALLIGVFCGERPLRPPTRRTVLPSSPRKANASSGGSEWINSSERHPCPVCGRDHSGACSINGKGDSVWCCHGDTKSAPDCSKAGETIQGRDGQTWGYVRTEEHESFGERSLFVLDKPRPLRSAAGLLQARRPSKVAIAADDDHSEGSQRAKPLTTVASGIKPIKLQTGEIVAGLPHRVGIFRLNTRTQEIHADDLVISANAISRLYLTLSNAAETWPKDATYDAAMQLAQQNSFDPIAEYLRDNSASPLTLEDWQRLDQYLLGVDDPVAAAFFPRYLMAAVARTREPGCDFRQVPVLVGPQWLGKTALGRILFGSEFFVSGVGGLDKDALMRCHRGWGVELAELDGITRKADQEELKQFISETSDVFRLPYDKSTERWPRRFLFWGTSNGAALRDITGSSRYVCIAVERMLPLDRVAENRDAIWRRALLQYEAGENWKDCDQESRDAIFERNDNYSEEDPWLQVVSEFLDKKRKAQDLPVHIPAILEQLDVPQERRSNQLSTRIQRLAVSLGWRTDRRTINGKRVKGLWPPATPATPVPHRGQMIATPPGGNGQAGSARPAIPGTPTEEDVVDRELELCSGNQGTIPDTFEHSGVAASSNLPKRLHRSRSDGFAWGGSRYGAPATGMATVGSGADAFADDDDPAWGPRPEVA
jgi:predicted P-loop ATPase